MSIEELRNDMAETIGDFIADYYGDIDRDTGRLPESLARDLANGLLSDLTCWLLDSLPDYEQRRVTARVTL